MKEAKKHIAIWLHIVVLMFAINVPAMHQMVHQHGAKMVSLEEGQKEIVVTASIDCPVCEFHLNQFTASELPTFTFFVFQEYQQEFVFFTPDFSVENPVYYSLRAPPVIG